MPKLIYAAIALLMIPLLLPLPERRYADAPAAGELMAALHPIAAMQHGAEVVRVAPEGLDAWMNDFRVIQAFEIWNTLGGWVQGLKPEFGGGIGDYGRPMNPQPRNSAKDSIEHDTEPPVASAGTGPRASNNQPSSSPLLAKAKRRRTGAAKVSARHVAPITNAPTRSSSSPAQCRARSPASAHSTKCGAISARSRAASACVPATIRVCGAQRCRN